MAILIFLLTFSFAKADIAWNEVGGEFAVPVTTNAKYVFLGGLGLAIYLKQATPDFVESMQRTWNQDKPFDEYSKYGDYFGQGIPNIIYFLGMWSHFYFTKSDRSKDRSLMMFKTSFYSTVLTHTLKLMWQEPRPDSPNQKDSFPSGHTTSAFAFASMIGMEHGFYWGTAAYLAATYAGFSRINDNRHRINDVVAGASIGMSYGLGLYYRQQAAGGNSQSAMMVLPTENFDGVAFAYATPF